MNEAIQDGVGQSWVCNNFPPAIHGHLTCNEGCASFVAILNDLQEIAALVVIEFFRSPAIEDQQVGPGKRFEDPAVSPVAFCKREGGEQPGNPMVGD